MDFLSLLLQNAANSPSGFSFLENLIKQGIWIFLSVVMSGIAIFAMKSVMRSNREQSKHANEQNKGWQDIVLKINENVAAHNSMSALHISQSTIEHQSIFDLLRGKINERLDFTHREENNKEGS